MPDMFRAGFLAVLVFFSSTALVFAETLDIELSNGEELSIDRFNNSDKLAVLWLPGNFSYTARMAENLEAVSHYGFDIWVPDFHGSWFIPPGRDSLKDLQTNVLLDLMRHVAASNKRVLLVAQGKVSTLLLKAIREWQQLDIQADMGGALLLSPKLFSQTPQGGEPVVWDPVTRVTNAPLYLVQPELSSAFWHFKDVVSMLQQQGLNVYSQTLPRVGDGVHARENIEDAEMEAAPRFPKQLAMALKLLNKAGDLPERAKVISEQIVTESGEEEIQRLLREYPGKIKAPALVLKNAQGVQVDVADLNDDVLLINFWATWCPPCVEELPSLQVLQAKLGTRGLKVLTVEVGNQLNNIESYMQNLGVDLPVLVDSDAQALKDWSVYAFPTTFILDRDRHIRYAVFGAMDWSSEEVVSTLQTLFLE